LEHFLINLLLIFDIKQEVNKFLVVKDVDIVIQLMKKLPTFSEPKALFMKSLLLHLAHTSLFHILKIHCSVILSLTLDCHMSSLL